MIHAIYNNDCMNILPNLKDNSVDFCITDPPYNIGQKGNNKLTKMGDKIVENSKAFGWDYMDNYFEWVESWMTHLYRVVKHSAFIFFDLNEIGKLKDIGEKVGFYSKTFFCIVKNNPLPHFCKNGYRSGFELGILFLKYKKTSKFNFLKQEEMINVKNYTIGNKLTKHPTEKPIEVIKHLVHVMSDEGDCGLDPFAGSGNHIIAMKELRRGFVGIEKDTDYYNAITERLNNTKVLQKSIFKGEIL
jgi:DNA modification methylase